MTYAAQMFPDLTSGNICADASVSVFHLPIWRAW